jgi:hypothetical protein
MVKREEKGNMNAYVPEAGAFAEEAGACPPSASLMANPIMPQT